MTTKNIPISQIENNTGQVEGLPGNPRITNPVKLDKLVESIKQDPEMLQLRGLLVYPFADDKYITIGGNMRLQALKRLNYTECPCIVIPKDTPVAKLRNYIVKDNGDFGDWDYKALLAEWDAAELESWAIDVQPFENEETKEKKRAGWNSGENAQECVYIKDGVVVAFAHYEPKQGGFYAFNNEGQGMFDWRPQVHLANLRRLSYPYFNEIKKAAFKSPEEWFE